MNSLSSLRRENYDNLIVGNLNINSLPNKFDAMKYIIKDKLDIFVITETKLDNSFPKAQSIIDGYHPPFTLDRNRKGGGIILYVRSDLPCKVLNGYNFPSDVEAVFLEIHLNHKKWLICGTYHPPKQNDKYFFSSFKPCVR